MDNHSYYLLCAAIAPVLAGLGYIFAKDRYNKEPFGMLVGAFLSGVLTIIPICLVEGFLVYFLTWFVKNPGPLLNSFWHAFIVAAFTEEYFKLRFLRKFIWNNPEFDERFDGIVYGVFVSMGFACAENILYIFSSLSEGGVFSAYYTSITRAIFSIPCHFFCGVILGYYLSLAKFEYVNQTDDAAREHTIFKGLLIAILFHGLYDFILMYQDNYLLSVGKEFENSPETKTVLWSLFGVFLIFNIIFWKFGRKRIIHMASLLAPNSSDEGSAFITCSNCGKTYASNLKACPNCKQLTGQTILAQNNPNSALDNPNLHNMNMFSSNHGTNRPNKNPFEL